MTRTHRLLIPILVLAAFLAGCSIRKEPPATSTGTSTTATTKTASSSPTTSTKTSPPPSTTSTKAAPPPTTSTKATPPTTASTKTAPPPTTSTKAAPPATTSTKAAPPPTTPAPAPPDDGATGLGSAATATKDTVRLPGATPIEDAVDTANAVFPATSPPSRPRAITLVDTSDWRAAIAASVFAGQRTASPILFSQNGSIPPATRAAIDQLRPTGIDEAGKVQVIRVGSAPAPGGLTTKVLAGPDPFATAAAIDRLNTQILGRPAGHVIIASGEHPEWAMPAAAWAARAEQPILYTGDNAIPAATVAALKAHKKPHLYLLGPKTLISDTVKKQLGKMAKDVTRIEGPTPVDNSVAFARFARATFGWGFVTPGHNFTVASTSRPLDAAAAAVLGSNGIFAPLLLVDRPAPLSLPIENYLLDVQPGYDSDPSTGVFNRVFILGGPAAVSGSVQGRLDEITKLVPVTIDSRATAPSS